MTARVDQGGRGCGGYFARRLTNARRIESGLEVGPFGVERLHVFDQLFESRTMPCHVIVIVEVLIDQHIHPGEQ